jgi:dedicator of cytokinesis protein 3
LERTVRKTQEMTSVERKVLDGDEDMIPLLADAMSISVSHNSEASIARYRDLLPSPTFDEEGEEQRLHLSSLENALKMALVDHAIMIKRILLTFAKSPHQLLRSRYEELNSRKPYFIGTISEYPTLIVLEFEQVFAQELVTLAPAQPRQTTPPPWSIASPQFTSCITSPVLPTLGTNSTMQTSTTLDRPARHRNERSRLGFLNRGPKNGPPVSFKLNGQKKGSDAGSTHSGRSRKENRRSFFGGKLEGKSETGDGGDGDWVTESGDTRDMGLRRSESQGSGGYGRPMTATSVGSKVGSVKKRLSRLTLGRKGSRREFAAAGVIREAD